MDNNSHMINQKPVCELPPIESVEGLRLYIQYSDDPAIIGFFRVLKQIIYEKMLYCTEAIKDFSNQQKQPSEYIQFYYENLMGFWRSFGETRVRYLYDTGEKYDSGIDYDSADFDGLLDLQSYQVLCRYLIDYFQRGFTLGWLTMFICEFLETSDFEIETTQSSIIIKTKRTSNTVLLTQIFVNLKIYDNLPAVNFDFQYT